MKENWCKQNGAINQGPGGMKMGVRYRMEETGAHNGCFIDEHAASLTKFFAAVKA